MKKKKSFEDGLKEIIKDCKENNILKDFFNEHDEDEIIGMVYTDIFHNFISDLEAKGLSPDEIKAEVSRMANS